MAVGTTTESDVKKSIENLSNELDRVFKKIQSDAFKLFDGLTTSNVGFTKGFKDAVKEINNMSSIADRYNGYAKLSEVIQSKINELKSKSGYLDSLSLEFKEAELDLQKQITTAQISRLLRSTSLDAAAKKEAIDTLKVKMIMADAELDYLQKNSNKQNEIVEKLERINKKIKDISPELEKQNGFASSLKSSFNEIKQQHEVIFYIASKIVTAFTSIEDAAFEVRKSLGLIGKEGDRFKTTITDVYVRFANLGVTAETVQKSIIAISNGFGSSVFASKQLVENFSILETSLGIASETSAKVLRTFMGLSKSSAATQESLIYYAQSLSQAAGVPFPEVMKDLSVLAENVRLTFRGTTVQLTKAAVEARRLGLSIGDVASVAEKLLDFQESINAEIEASVMMGKNISFNEARVLAYRGDILGATKNVLDTVEKTVDLNKVDYFTLKSIAAATGLSVDKLQDSLQIRKDVQLLSKMGTDEARAQVAEYQRLNNLSNGLSKTEGERALDRLKETNNLAIQKQLQSEFNGLILQLGQIFLPVLQTIGKMVSGLTAINNYIREIPLMGKLVAGTVAATVAVGILTIKWGNLFTMLFSKIPIIGKLWSATGAAGGAAGTVGSAASGVAMWKNLLGAAAIIVATAGALYIVGKALKEFPADIGGMGYMEFFLNLVGGLSIFLGFATILGLLLPKLVIPLALAGVAIIGLSAVLGTLGLALQSIANPIKTFSDSFSKLIENINVENLSKIKDGALAVKEAVSELRGELQNFNDKDLKVLENLGNLKANITAGVNTESEEKKKSESTVLAETIKSAVVEGMKQVKFAVNLDGKVLAVAVANITANSQPAGANTLMSKQVNFA